MRRGLANRVPGTQPRYVAIAPDIALAPLISKQEDRLRQARTESNDLAAGMTDDNIARAMGWSLSTAQRHTQRLMQQLNASSRFQAGMAAHERGWV